MFDSIKGQDTVREYLAAALRQGLLTHAYIFSGPEGVGKMATAAAFTAACCCESSSGEAPCGTCATCKRIKSGNYPYVKSVEPEKKTIKIQQIREIHEYLKFKVEGRQVRFILVDKAHLMTPEAGNSLLRLLEEPPGGTCFILTVDNIQAVLPTIISRCQVINFRKLSVSDIRSILREKGYDDDKAESAASMAAGSVARALELVEDERVLDQRGKILAFLSGVPLSTSRVLEFAQELHANFEFGLTLSMLRLFYRDALVWEKTRNAALLLDPDLYSADGEGKVQAGNLIGAVEKIMEAERAAAGNANAQLVLENLLLKLNQEAS